MGLNRIGLTEVSVRQTLWDNQQKSRVGYFFVAVILGLPDIRFRNLLGGMS
jgi:hypothetical protein